MRYYYTDPLAAAYMTREFGVKFENMEGSIKIDAEFYDTGEISYTEYGLDPYGYLYIDSDCYELVKPQVGDLIKSRDAKFAWKVEDITDNDIYGMVGLVTFHGKKNQEFEIIQRNDKAFFMPEAEE